MVAGIVQAVGLVPVLVLAVLAALIVAGRLVFLFREASIHGRGV